MPDYRKMTQQQKAANDERRRIGRERHAEQKLHQKDIVMKRKGDAQHPAQVWHPEDWNVNDVVRGRHVADAQRADDAAIKKLANREWEVTVDALGAGAGVQTAPRFEISLAEMIEHAPVRTRVSRRKADEQGEDDYSVWGLSEADEAWEEAWEGESEMGWHDDDWGELLKGDPAT